MIGINDAVIEDAATASGEIEKPKSGGGQKASGLSGAIDRVLNLLSSVPFGITLLMLLITACMIGMLIQQQELDSFPAYYAELTPAEKTVYGRLGFFDIYHAAYFNLLLLLLSLNIILASIDHFPSAWSFIARKKLTASPIFAMAQKFKENVELPQLGRQQLVERAAAAARKTRFKVRITEEDNRTTIFAERGVWNRLGAYVVHIGLLTIFAGGFMTSRGFTGMMNVRPDQSSDRMVQNVFNIDHANTEHAIGQRELELPFSIEGVDIQQKLINKNGSIDAGNTLDWLTRVRIVDRELDKTTEALIHMNTPFDYRGYRFFQASFNPLGSARTIKLNVTPANGSPQEITIQRNGEAKLADGTRVRYTEFNPHFVVGSDQKVTIGSTEYENPAAHLAYVTPSGEQGDVWAFTQGGINQMSNAPFLKSKFLDTGAFQFVLTDFEKVPFAHTLSIQFDPGARVVYVGFTILCLTLIAVFFFSHQRLWIVVEDGNVYLGGNANRNRLGFEDRAKKLAALIREPQTAS
ncbi:MAG: cytochrome c biogenesis protein ResB [Blastocatellales bacterium]